MFHLSISGLNAARVDECAQTTTTARMDKTFEPQELMQRTLYDNSTPCLFRLMADGM